MVTSKEDSYFELGIKQGPVVQRVDKAMHQINHYPVNLSVNKTNYAIHWIVIYSVDSVIHPLSNQALDTAEHRLNRTLQNM